jgi:hypothetical protein
MILPCILTTKLATCTWFSLSFLLAINGGSVLLLVVIFSHSKLSLNPSMFHFTYLQLYNWDPVHEHHLIQSILWIADIITRFKLRWLCRKTLYLRTSSLLQPLFHIAVLHVVVNLNMTIHVIPVDCISSACTVTETWTLFRHHFTRSTILWVQIY